MRSRLPLAVLAQLLVAARGCVVVSDSYTDRDDATCAAGVADDGENLCTFRAAVAECALCAEATCEIRVGTAGIHMILAEVNMTVGGGADASPQSLSIVADGDGDASFVGFGTSRWIRAHVGAGSSLSIERADAWSFSAPDGDGGSLPSKTWTK